MANYTIIATITKVEGSEFFIKGVAKHLYEDSNKKQWNILENTADSGNPKLKALDLGEKMKLAGSIEKTLIVSAMLQKRPLKLIIADDNAIIAVEVP